MDEVKSMVSGLVETAPWAFAFALFVLSVLVNSQGATVATLFPVAIAIGIPAPVLIGVFVAVNGYFFIRTTARLLPRLTSTPPAQPVSVNIFSTIALCYRAYLV